VPKASEQHGKSIAMEIGKLAGNEFLVPNFACKVGMSQSVQESAGRHIHRISAKTSPYSRLPKAPSNETMKP
jgi:hypothetical protein